MYKFMNFGKWLHPDATGGGTSDGQAEAASEALEPAAGDDDKAQEADGTAAGEGDGEPSKEPETKKLTQAEIDEIANKAYARGAKAGKREVAQKQKGTEAQPADKNKEADAAIEAKRQALTARELRATVRDLAGDEDIAVTKKGYEAALKLADFSECYDENGELDEEEVKEVLTKFASEWSEFKKAAEKPAKYAAGTGTKKTTTDAFANALGLTTGGK